MPSPRTKSGQQSKRLTEVARHVVLPEGIVTTAWPSVRDKCKLLGIEFDMWQHGAGRAILAKRANGRYAAGIGGVVLSIPRQVGKTFLIGAIVFALCLLHPGRKVIWSAHHTNTADETFEAMQAFADRSKVRPHIRRILTGGGDQIIDFKNGSRIEFGARTSGFGRGKTKVDILVLDEAQILKAGALENMVPAAAQGTNRLVFMMGTPPRPEDPSEAFASRRSKALSGKSKDVLYIEFSADKDARSDDRKQWRKANPSYPARTDDEAMQMIHELLPSDAAWRREALGIWDDEDGANRAVRFPLWRRLTIDPSEVPAEGRVAYAVRFSLDGRTAALAAARRPKTGPIHVEGVEVFDMVEGIGPIVDWLKPRAAEATHVWIDGRSGVDLLVQALRDAGVRNKRLIMPMNPGMVIAACAEMLQGVTDMNVSHIGQPLLNRQVEIAERRKIGQAGGFGWAAPEGEDVSLFEAATYAYAAVKNTKSRRGVELPRGVVLTR